LDLGPLGCLMWEWSPDLDADLLGPGGVLLTSSTCAAGDNCVSGRQETLEWMPTQAGTYTIRIQPFADSPNNGMGGSFSIDLFTGPLGSGPSSSPSPSSS